MENEKLIEIKSPKIDIELCTRDNDTPPINKVHGMDEKSFEEFINEWLYACHQDKYSNIQRNGAAGDKGRDIVATCKNGTFDYFQCKHYNSSLSPSEFYIELGKLCYYTFKKEYDIPQKYYIIASHDIGPKLANMIEHPHNLKKLLIDEWDEHCKKDITKKLEIKLDEDLKNYIENFDFSIIEHIPIQKIIDEYIETTYGKIRFGGKRIQLSENFTPQENIERQEIQYIEALLEAYSEYAGMQFHDVKILQINKKLYNDLQSQRKYFYSAETIRRFVRDTFINEDDFECLENEIYEGIKEVYDEDYKDGYKRLKSTLKQVTCINTSKALLDSKLNLIGNNERKGICHMLVEDKNISWVKKYE